MMVEKLKNAMIDWAINRSKIVAVLMVLVVIVAGAFLSKVVMDTDPENMLMKTEPARIFHNETKKAFELSEIVVLGVVNEKGPDGVFTVETLGRIHELTEFAKTLKWRNPDDSSGMEGVIEVDMVAPSLMDHMSQAGPGTISFEWLMSEPPTTREEAVSVREKALSNPLLVGQMVSEDAKALCIYLPLTDKLLSYKVYTALQEKIAGLEGDEEWHITGLPVAEGAIGVEMFTQMGLGSMLSMAVIFALLFFFFRTVHMIVLPILIATVSIIVTMGAMIAAGYPVHILSSMLPIFLMSVSMVDTVHILSEFFDVYDRRKDRKENIRKVMSTLFTPMLYTSLTTAAGFCSLVFAPIPPAQVFGLFLSIGVLVSWLVTILFVPAYIMFIPDKRLESFGLQVREVEKRSLLTRGLRRMGFISWKHSKFVLVLFAGLVLLGVWGIGQIQVNDNYAKRFVGSHPIRKADVALNEHFGGTYMANLILEGKVSPEVIAERKRAMEERMIARLDELSTRFGIGQRETGKVAQEIRSIAASSDSENAMLTAMIDAFDRRFQESLLDEESDFLQALIDSAYRLEEELRVFKRPDVLQYVAKLQGFLESGDLIGKSSSVADVVKKVNQELTDGEPENFVIPESLQGVAECYMQYQQGHRPHDLWHMVTPDFQRANVTVQFRTGDSRGTKACVEAVDRFFAENEPPVSLQYNWAGLHYINLVLEERIVEGFLQSFAGSFIIVFLIMSFLFRSPLWGALCMVPLSITLLMIYGITGLIGKDYDLPVAVLSSLSLGMAVDFAIHFLSRSRTLYDEKKSWRSILPELYGEPARAISRNVLVIAVGFLPLVVAPLVPYKTTGVMLFGILTISGIVTLLLLPAMLRLFEKTFFKRHRY
ncbi:efflux RND transporter permease subunit [Prosthecochloris sp. SCSIO W1103]|uniref:efflux RND transporter permease subunit n=1 Tax=Prosthecochloris sp. SCSIO W1103 TaxID=2992244 RepID=UPI00223D5D7F|nr:MMPL family transporter [Prosthecochloris sp. SCSIO W1103]UZJ36930.1 MMPL family transporter [Prosthecochloris sp. SCSIO W1103]